MSEFGRLIRRIRKEKKLSLKDVAKRGGLSHAYISQIENGKRVNPTGQVINKLAKGLGVPVYDLLAISGYYNEEDLLEPIEETIKSLENRLSLEKNNKLKIDLEKVIEMPNLNYKNNPFTNHDRELLKNYLETLFSNR